MYGLIVGLAKKKWAESRGEKKHEHRRARKNKGR
jgi:hypothetical protein